jgi:putative ABC transport system permease protein
MTAESIKYSLKNLEKRKSRSFLTIFSIMIGIATIFIFISFGYGLYAYVNSLTTSSSLDKLLIQSKGGVSGLDETFKLTDSDVRAVKNTAGVLDASGAYFKSAEIDFKNEKKYGLLFGYDPKKPLVLEIFNIGIDKGRELRPGDTNVVVLGYNYELPKKIFTKPVELNDKVSIQGKDFKVIGFYKAIGNPSDDSQIYVSSDAVKEIYPNATFGWIIAKVDIKSMNLTIDRVENSLRKERGLEKGKEDFYVQTFQDMINSYSKALNIIIAFVILIALISVLVSAVNTANTMITSVLERYKEIGIMKAIGARNSEILKIYLFESSFLGFVAGVAGVAFGFLLTLIAKYILISLGWSFLKPVYNFWTFFGCIIFATLTGAISGALPAIRASKIDPVKALRYE